MTLVTTHRSNLSYLPPGSDEAIRNALEDQNAFRGNKMAQLKQATDDLRRKIDEVVEAKRAAVSVAVESRKAQLVGSNDFAKASPAAQQSVVQRVDQMLSRISAESQIALILQIGSDFDASVYPSLLDQLAASQGGGRDDVPPPKQTVSVKTIPVPGASGVLETEADVDKYLGALRAALIQTLIDGKRISL